MLERMLFIIILKIQKKVKNLKMQLFHKNCKKYVKLLPKKCCYGIIKKEIMYLEFYRCTDIGGV
jgi:hypothetical protein